MKISRRMWGMAAGAVLALNLGLPAAQALAQDLLVQACAALDQSGLPQDDVQALRALAHQVVGRSH